MLSFLGICESWSMLSFLGMRESWKHIFNHISDS